MSANAQLGVPHGATICRSSTERGIIILRTGDEGSSSGSAVGCSCNTSF